MGDRFDRSRSRPGRMAGRDRMNMPAMFDEDDYYSELDYSTDYSSSEYTIDPRGRGGGLRPPPHAQGRVPDNRRCNNPFCNINHRGDRGGGRGGRGGPPLRPHGRAPNNGRCNDPFCNIDHRGDRGDRGGCGVRGGRGGRGYPPPPPYQESETDNGRCDDPFCTIDHRGGRGRGTRGFDMGRGPFLANQGRGGYGPHSDEESDYYLSDDEPRRPPFRPRGPVRRPQGPARRPRGRNPGRRGEPESEGSW